MYKMGARLVAVSCSQMKLTSTFSEYHIQIVWYYQATARIGREWLIYLPIEDTPKSSPTRSTFHYDLAEYKVEP